MFLLVLEILSAVSLQRLRVEREAELWNLELAEGRKNPFAHFLVWHEGRDPEYAFRTYHREQQDLAAVRGALRFVGLHMRTIGGDCDASFFFDFALECIAPVLRDLDIAARERELADEGLDGPTDDENLIGALEYEPDGDGRRVAVDHYLLLVLLSPHPSTA